MSDDDAAGRQPHNWLENMNDYIYEPLLYCLSWLDFFGIGKVYLRTINSFFWLTFKLPGLNRLPSWLRSLLYLYIVIAPHIMITILLYKMIHENLVLEPARIKKANIERRAAEKKAAEEFDRLYEMGGKSCPVLRCMS